MMPSSKTIEDSMVLCNADPQVNAPNITMTNNPVASDDTYHYPRVQYPEGSPMNTPKMTILPPKTISPDAHQNFIEDKYVKHLNRKLGMSQNPAIPQTPPMTQSSAMTQNPGLQVMAPNMIPPGLIPGMGGSSNASGTPANFDISKITQQVINNLKKNDKNIEVFSPNAPQSMIHKKRRRRRTNRKLFGNGMFNAGPGFVDVGSMGMNSVNMAAANPNMSSMGPFIPQQGPPSPIRIKIRDPWTPKKKKVLLSQAKKMMNKVMMQNIMNDMSASLASFSDLMGNFHSAVKEKLNDLNNVVLETQQVIHKENSSAQLVPEMIKQKFNLDGANGGSD